MLVCYSTNLMWRSYEPELMHVSSFVCGGPSFFYWIWLVAVHIMLSAFGMRLQRRCRAHWTSGACVHMCVYVCLSVSFSFYLTSTWAVCTYWFFCGAAVSPAAFCLSRLQLWKSEEEMDGSSNVGGRERSGDRLWEKSKDFISARVGWLLYFKG